MSFTGFRKGIIIAALLTFIGGDLASTLMNSYPMIAKAETETVSEQAVGINVAYHTEEDIRNYLKLSGATPYDTVQYKEQPSTEAPYKAGSLTEDTLASAIRMLNQIRYIAGISYNVTLSDEAITKTQAASLVNRVNGHLSHFPERPSDMEEALYQLGAQGAGSSNLAAGFSTINSSMVHGYMDDGDSSNIDRVGHRRWILNPTMSATGFGYCDGFSALYAFDFNNRNASEYGVAWPAQTMPTDYFGPAYPWSISMDYVINKEQVQVSLMRLSDQRTWNFSCTSADGYFNVENSGYGQSGCIIFRPEDLEGYSDGDQFQVTISGLNTPVSYRVNFFDLVPVTEVTIEKNATRLIPGEEIYLETHITPSDASNHAVRWTSSDSAIAEVSEYGSVIAKGYGKATITATSLSNGLTASYPITVVPASVEINKLTSAKKGQITISYQKDRLVSGYEIIYATNAKFSKNKNTKVVNKATTTKVTISGLKSGQLYYVKVRSFVMINNTKVYGDYGYPDYVWVRD